MWSFPTWYFPNILVYPLSFFSLSGYMNFGATLLKSNKLKKMKIIGLLLHPSSQRFVTYFYFKKLCKLPEHGTERGRQSSWGNESLLSTYVNFHTGNKQSVAFRFWGEQLSSVCKCNLLLRFNASAAYQNKTLIVRRCKSVHRYLVESLDYKVHRRWSP